MAGFNESVQNRIGQCRIVKKFSPMPYRQHTDNQRAFTVTPFVYDVIQAGQSCSVSGSDSPIIENQEVYLFQLFTELPVFQKSSFSGPLSVKILPNR